MSLKVKNLTKSFDGKIIFRDFSYEFSDKGIYALSGESGIGKTTLLRIIAGLDTDYTGDVLGGGIGSCSFAFQEHRLFEQLNALENVAFAISDRKDEAVISKATNLLTRLGLSEDDQKLLPGQLSGGMKQRVSIARALLRESKILLLDEPTKELDEANAGLVRQLILEASRSRLVILATHNKEDLSSLSASVISIQ